MIEDCITEEIKLCMRRVHAQVRWSWINEVHTALEGLLSRRMFDVASQDLATHVAEECERCT